MPLAGTSPMSRSRAHYMWAKRYNDENNVRKSIAHLDRAMAYGARSPRSPHNSKGVVYARNDSGHSGFFYHVTDTSIGIYSKVSLVPMYSAYVIQSHTPRPNLSLTISLHKNGDGSVVWPNRSQYNEERYNENIAPRIAEIEADVRSICETKLGWKRIYLREWPESASEDTAERTWRTYPDVRTCVAELYSKSEAAQKRKRERKKGMCFVCLDKPTEVACLPCGHKCFCEEDAPSVIEEQTCPACAMPIASLMRIFES